MFYITQMCYCNNNYMHQPYNNETCSEQPAQVYTAAASGQFTHTKLISTLQIPVQVWFKLSDNNIIAYIEEIFRN